GWHDGFSEFKTHSAASAAEPGRLRNRGGAERNYLLPEYALALRLRPARKIRTCVQARDYFSSLPKSWLADRPPWLGSQSSRTRPRSSRPGLPGGHPTAAGPGR